MIYNHFIPILFHFYLDIISLFLRTSSETKSEALESQDRWYLLSPSTQGLFLCQRKKLGYFDMICSPQPQVDCSSSSVFLSVLKDKFIWDKWSKY